MPKGVLAIAAVIFACLGACLRAEANTEVARKPYALFNGMDLQAGTDDGVFPVVGFTNKRIYVARNGGRDPLSTSSKISYALRSKLSSKWVDLEVISSEKFYSKMASDLTSNPSSIAQLDRAQDEQVDYNLGRTTDDDDTQTSGVRRLNSGVANLAPQSDETGQAGTYGRINPDLDEKLRDPEAHVDSLRVTLRMKSGELYKGVYLVLIAQVDSPFTEPDARPLIQVVGQLKPDTKRQIKVVFENLPEGFDLLGLKIHVYSQGEEIPHQGSAKLRMMSEEEAFTYSLGQYKHSGKKSEPTLFRPMETEAITSFLSEKEILQIKADLIVHPDGSTTVDYLNTPNEPMTRRLVGLLEGVRFIPAMENGEPMESRVSLQLSKLVD